MMNKLYGKINWKNYPNVDSPLNDENLNKIDYAMDEIDNRVITLDTTKAAKTEVATMIADVSFDETTGIFTFMRKNGATFTVDTLLEKIIINFDFDRDAQKLIIKMEDGTKKEIDLSVFITQYEFVDSETIAFSLGNDGKVTAIVKEGSIREKHLRPDYLSDIKVESAKAEASATAAKTSEENAKGWEEKAEKVAEDFEKNGVTGVKGESETIYRKGNVNITKGNIGLGYVDNTSDKNKPISDKTQEALNKKLSLDGGTVTGDVFFNRYVSINAWNGYGSGTAKLWYDGTDQTIKSEGSAKNIGLNAKTATKLETQRTIGLSNGFAGSAVFDGSGDCIISADFVKAKLTSYNTHNYPWHRIATVHVGTGLYQDKDVILDIRHTFYTGGYGRLKISIRTNSQGADVQATAVWIYRYGITKEQVKIGRWGKSGDDVYADIFYLYNSNYCRAEVVQILGNDPHRFTLIESVEAFDTTATDEKTSSEVYVSPEAAALQIHEKAYTTIETSTDNSSQYLPLTGGVLTGDLYIPATRQKEESAGIVAAGNLGTLSAITNLSEYKSFLGSLKIGSNYYTVISSRHKNGSNDGQNYGVYLKTLMSTSGDLEWDKQTGANAWQGVRTLLDSKNWPTQMGLTSNTLFRQVATNDASWKSLIGIDNSDANVLMAIRSQGTYPEYFAGNFSSGIAFGGGDTKGVISLSYEATKRLVKFAGGNGNYPTWWFGIQGNSGAIYNLADFLKNSGSATFSELDVRVETSKGNIAIYADTDSIDTDEELYMSFYRKSDSKENYMALRADNTEFGQEVVAPNFSGKINGYTVNANVPSGAKFTDTNTWIALKGASASAAGTAGYAPAPPSDGYNTKFLRADGTWAVPPNDNANNAVTQTNTDTANANYRVLFSNTADDTTRTEGTRKDKDLTYNPSTGALSATKLTGKTEDSTVTFTSSDVADGSATSWTSVTKLATDEKHSSILAKISQMFKNIRYLYKKLGTTDISSIGDGTVTGAINASKIKSKDVNVFDYAVSMQTSVNGVKFWYVTTFTKLIGVNFEHVVSFVLTSWSHINSIAIPGISTSTDNLAMTAVSGSFSYTSEASLYVRIFYV